MKPLLSALIERFHNHEAGTPNIYVDDALLDEIWEKLTHQKVLARTTPSLDVEEFLEEPDEGENWEEDGEVEPNAPFTTASGVTLTQGQEAALTKLQLFVASSSNKYFRLTGYAGTGKSFLICEFMRWLQKNRLTFVAASPTNKASKNLSRLARSAGIEVEVTTIARLLGQQPTMNEETGVEEFVADEIKDLGSFNVVLLDEFSMINKSNFEQIQKAVTGKARVVFIGDATQLPPVGERESIVASLNIESAMLSEVVRYDGEIARVAEQIRSNSRYNSIIYPFTSSEDGTIARLPRAEWLRAAGQRFKSKAFRDNQDYCRFLVWRNKTADSLNAWVRTELWGEDAPPYVIGDRLIAKKPVFRLIASLNKKHKEYSIVMNNSEECSIIAQPELQTDSKGWEFWKVPVKTDDGNKVLLRLLTEESEKKRAEQIKLLNEKKRWSEAKTLDKLYDHCPFAYAITTHKAQGSGIDHVFLDVVDMRGNRDDLQKMQYTALTRAKVAAYIPG